MTSYISVQPKVEDTRGLSYKKRFNSLPIKGSVKSVQVTDVYTIDNDTLSKKQLTKVLNALTDALVEKSGVSTLKSPKDFDYVVEIGFLPGVTDNVGTTAQETIEDVLRIKRNKERFVYFSKIFFIEGALSKKDVEMIVSDLHNPLIERSRIKTKRQFLKDKGMGVVVPKVHLKPGKVDEVDLWLSDEELALIGKAGILNEDGTRRGPLGLGLDELKAIRTYFHNKKRLPTDIEIETLAQTWSEHCKHAIFANPIDEVTEGIYKKYIKGATNLIRKRKGAKDFCVSVFTDNSGVIHFDKDILLTHKVETHNSPSALDPFGGAVTGIVGVNRDTIGTGMGAKPILNYYGYCFADPADKTTLYRDVHRKQELLSVRRIMEGVVEGVNVGGNQSGIPTPQGFMLFEKRFRGKPLVFVGTVGVMPKKVSGKPSHLKTAHAGDYIVMVGGRVGLDGVHGATFSSVALDEGSPATAVQIGDPITQKKLSDVLIKEARDKGLYNSITDNGAGGLSSSVGEMAEESGGCEIWLEEVPLKYPGLSPWQIWISESQERMTLSVTKSKWKKLEALLEKRGVEATVVGEFTNSGRCVVKNEGVIVVDIEMDFLHDGLPVHFQESKKPERNLFSPSSYVRNKFRKDLTKTLLDILKQPSIASHEFVSRQYDHEVQALSVTKPLQGRGQVGAFATVSKPSTRSRKGVVLSQGINPTYSDIDTYHMAASALDTAVRNAIAVGADPDHLAILDNFCWCSSNEPERLYQLKRAAQACFDYARKYGTPFISGKDSMFNDFKGYTKKGPVKISIPPTLLISSIGVIPDAMQSVTLDPKQEGDLFFLLGDTKDELGASEYFAYISDKEKKTYTGEDVPKVNAEKNNKMYRLLHRAIKKGYIASSFSLSRGGLGVAIAKNAIAGQLGMEIDLGKVSKKLEPDTILFSESQGRILVTVAPENLKRFKKLMGASTKGIGRVSDKKNLVITNGEKKLVDVSVGKLTSSYRSTFKDF